MPKVFVYVEILTKFHLRHETLLVHLSVFVRFTRSNCFFPICQHSGRLWWLAWETCKVLPDSYKAHLRRHTLLILTHDKWLKSDTDLQRNAPINHICIHILEMDNTFYVVI